MTERQAAMTSMREFMLKMNAYQERQQVEWERSRWTAFSIFSPFVKNGPKTPQAWVRFPWEKPKAIKAVVITEKKENQLNNLYMDFMSRKNKIRS
jgi:hypothetical protein